MGYASGVGRKAPPFVLSDRKGDEVSLVRYRGDWFPILVFVPGPAGEATDRLARLGEAADQLWGLRGQLVAIHGTDRSGGDDRPRTAPEPPFPLLADDGTVAAAYGARTASGGLTPTTFIIDRAGKIVWTEEGGAALDPATIIAALRDVAR